LASVFLKKMHRAAQEEGENVVPVAGCFLIVLKSIDNSVAVPLREAEEARRGLGFTHSSAGNARAVWDEYSVGIMFAYNIAGIIWARG
jgi:hypothetical protein